ncbi:MAG: hypothetical protein K1X94_09045 [Sandaracinaceae bacterium]|nr:hypothetical protein [Sandaracinaceae bacterium]
MQLVDYGSRIDGGGLFEGRERRGALEPDSVAHAEAEQVWAVRIPTDGLERVVGTMGKEPFEQEVLAVLGDGQRHERVDHIPRQPICQRDAATQRVATPVIADPPPLGLEDVERCQGARVEVRKTCIGIDPSIGQIDDIDRRRRVDSRVQRVSLNAGETETGDAKDRRASHQSLRFWL